MSRLDFFADVLLPLVSGGPIRVTDPLDADDLSNLARIELLDDDKLRQAREQVAAEITLSPPDFDLDTETLALTVALYDALWLSHPEAKDRSPRRLERVARFAEKCTQVPPARTRETILARHTLLHHLFRISRTDRRVRFWVGSRTFLGREPPKRLLRWRDIRRVRVEEARRNWYRETEAPEAVRGIVRKLLAASPLTDVIASGRVEPPPSLAAIAACAGDSELARYACYQLVAGGLDKLAHSLGTQLADAAARRPSAPELRPALAFACHLHILEALAEAVPHWMENESAWPEHDEARAFCAAFAAAFKARFLPRGIAGDLEDRLARRAQVCARLAGPARMAAFAHVLLRHGRVLESSV
jgi:hypothetical protein